MTVSGETSCKVCLAEVESQKAANMNKIRGLIKILSSFIQVSQLFVVTTRHRILINVKFRNFHEGPFDPDLFSAGFWFSS